MSDKIDNNIIGNSIESIIINNNNDNGNHNQLPNSLHVNVHQFGLTTIIIMEYALHTSTQYTAKISSCGMVVYIMINGGHLIAMIQYPYKE